MASRRPSPRGFLAALLSAACFSGTAAGQLHDPLAIEGRWRGAFVREGSHQELSIELQRGASGGLSGTYSIPELGLYREPLTQMQWKPPALTFALLYGTFECTHHAELGEIVGTNERWGPPVRLHLKATDLTDPWGYEEVAFDSDGIALAGTVVFPEGPGPHPAAVVISGSSPRGRHDGKSAWVYRGWGEALAERGVAALVFDRRGVGRSGGDAETWDLEEVARDALAGVELLRSNERIDPARVGLVGTSQGGWIAPIAAVLDPKIAFLILVVPPAVSVELQELDAVAASLVSEEALEAGITEQHVEEAQEFQRRMFEVAYGRRPWSSLEPVARAARDEPWARFLEVPETEADLDWWRRNEFDPAETLRQVDCPVLALFGEQDLLVPPARNAQLLAQYLGEGGNEDVTLRVFAGVGHGCELPRGLVGDDWSWPRSFWVWGRKAPGFYACISGWLEARAIVR